MKYKHKQTGQIVTKRADGLYHSQEGGYTLQRWIFEKSNDWEEIKEEGFTIKKMIEFDKKHVPHLIKEEPNYLITSFREKGNGAVDYIGTDGLYGRSGISHYSLLNNDSVEIFSVKNSKGEEFVLGELVKFSLIKLKIVKFEISQFNEMHLFLENGNRYSLDLIFKVKQPIYTTTDGVEVFEGDRLWLFLINKDLTIPYANEVGVNRFNNDEKEVADRYLTFTSEENRDKYIKEHTRKPIFTSEDGKEMFEGDMVYMAILQSKTIVPYHASKDSTEGGIRFSSHEAASEYLKKLNPIFTSECGKEFYSDDMDYSLFSVLPKANWQENRYRLNDCIKFPEKEWLHFHTKEARQEYIDNNKPKFSLADVEKAYKKLMHHDFPDAKSIISELKKLGK
jgi:hypothetical protein